MNFFPYRTPILLVFSHFSVILIQIWINYFLVCTKEFLLNSVLFLFLLQIHNKWTFSSFQFWLSFIFRSFGSILKNLIWELLWIARRACVFVSFSFSIKALNLIKRFNFLGHVYWIFFNITLWLNHNLWRVSNLIASIIYD